MFALLMLRTNEHVQFQGMTLQYIDSLTADLPNCLYVHMKRATVVWSDTFHVLEETLRGKLFTESHTEC